MNALAHRENIKGIDGLRALAVVSVILYHMNQSWLPGGFVGVDVFFVISGYVVTRSIQSREWGNAGNFFATFFARRIARIYPALVLCLIVTAALHCLFVPKAWLNDTAAKAGVAAFFGLSNIALVFFDDGYFSPRSEFNPFTHTWSLGVEEQFYLLFAVVWWTFRKNHRVLAGVLVSSILVSLLWCADASTNSSSKAYYLLPSRWWELSGGALLAQFHHLNSNKSRHASIFGALGLALIAIGLVFADKKSFPYPDAILPVVGAILCIHGFVCGRSWPVMNVFESAVFQWVGNRSYSLYLWHWPAIVLFKWTVGLQGLWQVLSCAVIFIIVAWASYRWIEDPLRKQIPKAWSSTQVVGRGSVFVTLSAALTGCLFLLQSHLSLSVTSDTKTWYSALTAEQRDWTKVDTSKPVVYAFGDSHAGMLGVALQELERRVGVQTRVVSQPGCPVANLRTTPSADCQKFIDKSLNQLIKQYKEGDVVLLTSLRVQRFSDQWGLVNTPKKSDVARAQDQIAAFRIAEGIIKPLEKAGFKVVISAPLPVFKIPPFRCSDWFNKGNPVCDPGFMVERQDLVVRRASSMNVLAELKIKNPNLKIWDAFDVVCPPGDFCNPSSGGSHYFDGDHLTALGNRLIYPSLEGALREVGVGVSR